MLHALCFLLTKRSFLKMYKQLIINVTEHETRVALLDDGNIAELYVDRGDDSDIAGNIYKGRVLRVLPGMQAAFVDIGLERTAFLYVSDVYNDFFDFEKIMLENNTANEDPYFTESETPQSSPLHGVSFQIEDLLHEGQTIMVQVAKEPMGTKGARLTSHISIPGRHLVLMPTVNHIGISRRIEDSGERERLREIIEEMDETK